MNHLEKHYKFKVNSYNNDGFNKVNGVFFLDFLKDCERDFQECYSIFHANHLFASNSTMILIRNCMESEPEIDYGMELINGKVDLDTNLEIENHTERTTVYAIGSASDEDEPLFLINDQDVCDGMILLKYIPDGEDDAVEQPVQIPDDMLKFQPKR